MTPDFYSQSGEDVILATLLPDPSGNFVEVGCIDGLRFSNTYHFERRGWRGLCVEAHADYIPLLVRNRPGSVVIHAAAGKTDADAVTFYANKRGSLSTLDPTRETEFRERFRPWFSGFTPQEVPLRRLSSLIDAAALPAIDLLSVDVEGLELDVLRGLELERHRPRLMVLETDSAKDLADLADYLTPHGYRHLGSVSNNAFFARDDFTVPVTFDSRPVVASLNHTPHPLDPPSSQITAVEIAWRPAM